LKKTPTYFLPTKMNGFTVYSCSNRVFLKNNL